MKRPAVSALGVRCRTFTFLLVLAIFRHQAEYLPLSLPPDVSGNRPKGAAPFQNVVNAQIKPKYPLNFEISCRLYFIS